MREPSVVERELKRDLLGRVQLVRCAAGLVVRRVPTRVPGLRAIARLLIRREERALTALDGCDGVPALVPVDGPRGATHRSWIAGVPLSVAHELRRDFFERLGDLVRRLHARGVCHNDLHKEGNILVRDDGGPAVIDFQLASVHGRQGREFSRRASEDLRQVHKHHAIYARAMGGDVPVGERPARTVARVWRRVWKPFYNRLMRITGLRRRIASGEPARRRDRWPRWVDGAAGAEERAR